MRGRLTVAIVMLAWLPGASAPGEAPADEHAASPKTDGLHPLAPAPPPKEKGESSPEEALSRQGVLVRLKAGSLIRVDEKGGARIAGPGRDIDKFWDSHKELLPFQTLAAETGGVVTAGPADRIHTMFDLALQRTKAGMSMGIPEMDIAVLIDTTGSMGGAIQGVLDNMEVLSRRVGDMHKEGLRTRLALMAFQAEGSGNDYTTKVFQPFTYSTAAFAKQLGKLKANGGGDEVPYDAILRSQSQLTWREGAQRMIILITDEGPRERTLDGKHGLSDVIKTMQDSRTVVYPIFPGL